MLKNETILRVRYAETDQMGFVYYGNYAQYLEIGRVEALKSVGLSYRKLEESGYMLPVKDLKIEYFKAALYDDELTIYTEVREMPSNKIVFNYQIKRDEELLIVAETTLFFMNKEGRACRPPQFFLDHMKAFFKS